MAKRTNPASPRPGRTKQVQLSLDDEDLALLDYVCRRWYGRHGGNPGRMRSPTVRALIHAEAHREKARESHESPSA